MNKYVERNEQQDISAKWYNSSFWMILWALLFWPISAFGLSKTNRSMTFKAVIGVIVAIMVYMYITNMTK